MVKGKRIGKTKSPKSKVNILVLIIFMLVLSLTVGFSSFYSAMDIGSLSARVFVRKDIRVTGIRLSDTTSNAVSNWQDYNVKSISTNIDLPNQDSTVTYQVDVTNIGNIEMGIYEITGIPNNLEYSISNYTLKEELCDSVDSTRCKLGSKTILNITLGYKEGAYDSSNTNQTIILEFDFRRFYSISYVNIDSTNLPTKIMENDSMEYNLNTPYPSRVRFSGTTTSLYNASTGLVSLNNITDDVTISYTTTSYFVQYDGVNMQMFGIFDSTTITSFERNTTLTLAEVESKVANNQAYVISTSSADPNYPSNYEIYGWVDNGHFYWWSESDTVYYHPYTLGAFRLMTGLTRVDLTGTNTSLVRNFSHWFDKDANLVTINGRINTSGLVLEYNPSFNYANDNDENSSGGTGLAFMFNDCKVLTGIDLTEFTTTNAGDMKRMFGGCAKISSLDVSGFDTSNAKSMYWMFRKMAKLTEVDISNFNTSNVENMLGMFVSATGVQKIYLGPNFDTSKVKMFNYMFGEMNNIKTIYAYSDFTVSNLASSSNMFASATHLVGSANTLDETPYDSRNITATYAKLAQNGVKGYFTPYGSTAACYTITYNLDGGEATNPTVYCEDTRTFTLNEPEKIGYTFIGWTGSNGSTPEMQVTITEGSTGDRSYVANYEENTVDLFPKVFSISGSCNFNGSATNITGNTCISDLEDATDFRTGTYIDTGINLYNSENLYKDYEIHFEISNYIPSEQETLPNGNKQHTIMNTKGEFTGYPGVVVRRNSDSLEVKSFTKGVSKNYKSVSSYTIARINRKIYYSINDGALTLLDDNTSFNSPFNLSVWFGASKDSSGNPFRHSKCTLSNIYIKLGTYS